MTMSQSPSRSGLMAPSQSGKYQTTKMFQLSSKKKMSVAEIMNYEAEDYPSSTKRLSKELESS